MATHSRIVAWRIPRPAEPGGPQSMGSPELDAVRLSTHARFCDPPPREEEGLELSPSPLGVSPGGLPWALLTAFGISPPTGGRTL